MRGTDQQQGHVFSYISPEQRVRKDHPLRPIRAMVDKVLKELSPEFNKMYSKVGRPSIPPEQLLRALLLQMLYSVRPLQLIEMANGLLHLTWAETGRSVSLHSSLRGDQ
jgi:transposase